MLCKLCAQLIEHNDIEHIYICCQFSSNIISRDFASEWGELEIGNIS